MPVDMMESTGISYDFSRLNVMALQCWHNYMDEFLIIISKP